MAGETRGERERPVQPEDNRIRNSRLGRLVATALRSYFLPIPPAATPSQPRSSALFLRALFLRFAFLPTGNPFPSPPLFSGRRTGTRGGITSNYKKLSADQIRWRGGVLITTQKSGLDQLGTRLLSPAVNSFPSLVRGCTPSFLPSFLLSFPFRSASIVLPPPPILDFVSTIGGSTDRKYGDTGVFSPLFTFYALSTPRAFITRSFCPTAFKTGRL